jgi:actin cytoskeleton-regulatory complex protein PAN1
MYPSMNKMEFSWTLLHSGRHLELATMPAVSTVIEESGPSTPRPAELNTGPSRMVDDSDGTDDSSDDDFDTASEGEDEAGARASREAREIERRRVLEAAGLVVKSDRRPPPRPPKRRKSRTASAAFTHSTPVENDVRRKPEKDLPTILPEPEPEEPNDPAAHLSDAYDRYQAFRLARVDSNNTSNRLSVASFETASPHSPPSPAPTTESDTSRYSHTHFFQQLLGRKTPAQEESAKRLNLVISGPILGPISNPPSAIAETPTNSEIFGTVSK